MENIIEYFYIKSELWRISIDKHECEKKVDAISF